MTSDAPNTIRVYKRDSEIPTHTISVYNRSGEVARGNCSCGWTTGLQDDPGWVMRESATHAQRAGGKYMGREPA